jgi:hypothetical protein
MCEKRRGLDIADKEKDVRERASNGGETCFEGQEREEDAKVAEK